MSTAIVVISYRYNFLAEWASETWPDAWPIYVIHANKSSRQVAEFRARCALAGQLVVSDQSGHYETIDQLLGLGVRPNGDLRDLALSHESLIMLDHDVMFVDARVAGERMSWTVDKVRDPECLMWAQPADRLAMRFFLTTPWFVINTVPNWTHSLSAYGVDYATWRPTGNFWMAFDTGQRMSMKLIGTRAINLCHIDWPANYHIGSNWSFPDHATEGLAELKHQLCLSGRHVGLADVEVLLRSKINPEAISALLSRSCKHVDAL